MKDIHKYQDEMGETGVGILHESEINMKVDNPFTRNWGMFIETLFVSEMGDEHKCTAVIQEKCPWFFHLKAIIDEHPSLVPAGTGNNSYGYDLALIVPSVNTSEFESSDG